MSVGRGRVTSAIIYVFLTILICIYLYPILWMLLSAFKPTEEIFKLEYFIPSRFTLENLTMVVTEGSFLLYFRNSLFLSTMEASLVVITSCAAGYVFAKFRFRGKNMIFFALLGTLMIPFAVKVIPLYQMMIWLRWLNSYRALVIPAAFSTFGIFLHRQFLQTIPDDLADAARIDGCTEYGIFARLIIPLAKPAMAWVGILTFLGAWDGLLWPLIVLNSPSKYTLPIGLNLFQNENYVLYGPIIAGAFITVVPAITIFIILQRFFMESMVMSGLRA